MAHDVNLREKDVAAQVRSALADRISADRCDLWIPSSTKWSFEQDRLTLSFESDARCQYAKRNLAGDLLEAGRAVCGHDVETCFQVYRKTTAQDGAQHGQTQHGQTQDGQTNGSSKPHETASSDGTSLGRAPAAPQASTDSNVQLEATSRRASSTADLVAQPVRQGGDIWSRFITGRSNRMAVAAAHMVLSDPMETTLVFLHGPTGSGKTLLVDAITERLRTCRRMRRVVQMSSEQFTNDFTGGLRGGGLPLFRRKYRDVEALLVEDIQFLVGKKATLTEFKHTLDTLVKAGRQVVLTADRSLHDLSPLGNELVARIRGGLTAPIYPLDEETRLALLTREAKRVGLDLSSTLLEEIATRVTGDGRIILGIVKRLRAVARLSDHKFDWDYCWSAIHDLVQATQPVVRISDIEHAVCDVLGLEPHSLQSETKVRSVSQPRMLAMFLARKHTPAAYKEIGEHFGKRRHSTVISAEKTVELWLQREASVRLGKGMSVKEAIRHVESQLQVG